MADRIILSRNDKIDDSNFKKILDKVLLKVTRQYTFPPEIIKVQGIAIATIGNFSATTGKPKSKKTFNVSAIVASALSGKQVLQYQSFMPPNKRKVLYFDTEQSECHCHKVLHRILCLAGLPADQENDMIEFFVLRGLSPVQRRDFIDCTLRHREGVGLVVIDGARDLISDINSPNESSDIINDFMRWSSVFDLHIHTVLHLNKQDDNTRGHLGTELNNKAETVMQVAKCRDYPNVSEVRTTHARDKEFTPFAFSIDDNALPVIVEGVKSFKNPQERSTHLSKLTVEQHQSALEAAFEGKTAIKYKDLLESLQSGYESIGFLRGRNKLVDHCRFLQQCGALQKTADGYVYNPDFTLEGEADGKV